MEWKNKNSFFYYHTNNENINQHVINEPIIEIQDNNDDSDNINKNNKENDDNDDGPFEYDFKKKKWISIKEKSNINNGNNNNQTNEKTTYHGRIIISELNEELDYHNLEHSSNYNVVLPED